MKLPLVYTYSSGTLRTLTAEDPMLHVTIALVAYRQSRMECHPAMLVLLDLDSGVTSGRALLRS